MTALSFRLTVFLILSIVLKYARIVWVLAFCLMVAGTVVHACQDSVCASDHATQHDTAGSDDSGSRSDHFCGHCHCSSLPVNREAFIVLRPNAEPWVTLMCARPTSGPVKEIEHPPQLS